MKYFKGVFIITLVQLIVWTIFNLCDLFSEYVIDISMLISIILPVIVSILYLIKENSLYAKLQVPKIKFSIMVYICWILETVIIGSYICNLVNYNKWIIKQHNYTMGWGMSMSLNGIEYFVFAFALVILPIFIIIIVKTIKFLYMNIKKLLNN